MKNIKCWLLISCFLLGIESHAQHDNPSIDSLESALKMCPENDNKLFLIYQDLTNAYHAVDAKKSLEYAKMGILLAKKKDDLYQTAEFYYKAGNSFYYLNLPDSALVYYEKSLEKQKQVEKAGTENKEEVTYLKLRLFSSIAVINDSWGKFDVALENYLQALKVAEEMKDSQEIAGVFDNLANTYLRMSNYEQAEVYYLKEEKLCRELNDSTGIADALLGFCVVQIGRKDYTKALEYGEESYKILLKQKDVTDLKLMTVTQRLTEVWLRIPDYNKALEYARMTVKYATQTGLPSYKSSALYMLSSVYLKQEKYNDCEETAFMALNTDSSNIYINSVLYGNIAQANIHLGNSKKAIEYFGKTLDANRAYSNKNFQTSLSEMEVKYETEKKGLRILTLEEEKQWIVLIAITVTILLLSIAAGLFILYRFMVNKERLADNMIKQLKQEAQLIATQSVLDGETRERARLARDLHDGLGSLLTGVKLNLENMKTDVFLEKADIGRFDNALNILNESMKELRRVAHHLMPDSLSRFGLKPAVSDFCKSLSSNITFDYFGGEERLEPNMEVVIYRTIHELVNNALKHSGATQIMVQIMQESDRISFTVQDNGCGFDPLAENSGMGLANIRIRVASFGGNIQIDSKIGEGTEVNVEFKLIEN